RVPPPTTYVCDLRSFRSRELLLELVDLFHQQCFVVPRCPEERIQRDASVDPRGRVAGVQRVRQRSHQVLPTPQGVPRQRRVAWANITGEIGDRKSTDQVCCQLVRSRRVQVLAGGAPQAESYL